MYYHSNFYKLLQYLLFLSKHCSSCVCLFIYLLITLSLSQCCQPLPSRSALWSICFVFVTTLSVWWQRQDWLVASGGLDIERWVASIGSWFMRMGFGTCSMMVSDWWWLLGCNLWFLFLVIGFVMVVMGVWFVMLGCGGGWAML